MRENRFTLRLGDDPVRIQTGYDLLGDVAQWFCERRPGRILIMTDETVAPLYADRLVERLRETAPATVLTMPAGEKAKTMSRLERLLESAVRRGVSTNACVLSLGGGVVSNVAGLAASLLLRGLPLIHMPTTVLAQIDASISRKQAVNGRYGKNLFGAWKSPEAIFIDWDYLKTLDDRQRRTGLAEAVKLSLIADLAMFEVFESLTDPFWFRDHQRLVNISARALELTCEILRRDASEGTSGAALEIGHTVGHAIEILKAGTLTHGEAISIGMVIEARICAMKGWMTSSWPERMERVLSGLGLPTALPPDLSCEQVINALRYDNKRRGERLSFVPMVELGRIDQQRGREECPLDPKVLGEAALARAGT